MSFFRYFLCLWVLLCLLACSQPPAELEPKFSLHTWEETGLDLENRLVPDKERNIFSYMYFYNGAGLGAGDLNKDGRIDLCFTTNLGENKVFLNQGKLKFKDVSPLCGIQSNKAWSNGVSLVDINQDGKLDIYISQAAGHAFLKGKNLLFVCQSISKEGIPIYREQAHAYGLDLSGLGTQSAFFDADLDGDLDCFILNHSVHQNGTFGYRENFQGQFHPLAGDRYLENQNMHFVDKTPGSGIHSDALGYGLGLAVADINLDGYPDLYVGNDFHENDYLYLNQGQGKFVEKASQVLQHTSQFSMGIDIADINQDAYPEIMALDMLPMDRVILKRSEGEDSYNIFQYKLRQGYMHQYARNTLQLNRGGGQRFSEIGLLANVHASDWSWSPLFLDFENDGYRDLFISNGIPKRMNDIDYIQFASNEYIQAQLASKNMDENDLRLSHLLPEIKLPNQFFGNQKNLRFKDVNPWVAHAKPSFSNGAVYADFDGDGDLDIVTNNINEKAFLYENVSPHRVHQNDYLSLSLIGPPGNLNAIGAKIWIEGAEGKQVAQKFPVRGFQSSMEIPLHLGLGDQRKIRRIYLIWPDNTYQSIDPRSDLRHLQLRYQKHLPKFDYHAALGSSVWQDITARTGLSFTHQENAFNEFDREALIPHLASAEGPAGAVGDLNQDGLEDVFIGNARDQSAKIFLQTPQGRLKEWNHPDLEKDKVFEDVDAIMADFDGDHRLDLVVVSGGNEFSKQAPVLQPRLYLGGRQKKADAFEGIFVNASHVGALDFNADGAMDLVITGRSIPFAYGKSPRSYLLKNDGKGRFSDVTARYAPELAQVGMVRAMELADLDQDHDLDMILGIEWAPLLYFENQGGRFVKKSIGQGQGWWSAVKVCDIDADGDMDVLAGNLGLNSRLKANERFPVHMYLGDFDENQKFDQVLSYYLNGVELPFGNKMEMEKQFPSIKQQFLYARDFAKAEMKDFMNGRFLKGERLFANEFRSMLYINTGNNTFIAKPLPILAQLAPIMTFHVADLNGDHLPEVLIGANFFPANVQMGRYDADPGTVLINQGKGRFRLDERFHLGLSGELRGIKEIVLAKKRALLLLRNHQKALIYTLK